MSLELKYLLIMSSSVSSRCHGAISAFLSVIDETHNKLRYNIAKHATTGTIQVRRVRIVY